MVEISLSLSQLRDVQGMVLGTVGISKDVTEENRLRKQLLEQERLAAVGETVASVTHCMKNVLNGLKGGAYLVDVGLKRNDAKLTREGWETVQEGVDRISKISLNMLSYCRERRPVPVAVSPYQLARDAMELVQKSAQQQGIALTCHGAEDEIAYLDPDAVGRVLLNLVTNAVEACKEKTYGPGESPRVDVRIERAEGEIRFIVSDNGIGMGREVREQLFKRFFSTKSYKGDRPRTQYHRQDCRGARRQDFGRIRALERVPGLPFDSLRAARIEPGARRALSGRCADLDNALVFLEHLIYIGDKKALKGEDHETHTCIDH